MPASAQEAIHPGDFVTSVDFDGPRPIALVLGIRPNLSDMRAVLGRATYPLHRLVKVPLLTHAPTA
jgi:hypothetical protein